MRARPYETREVAVSIDEPGTGRGDDRVDVQDDREPAQAHRAATAERAELQLVVGIPGRPSRAQVARRQRAEERHLKQDVDHSTDEIAPITPAGCCASGCGLAGQLVGLLETE